MRHWLSWLLLLTCISLQPVFATYDKTLPVERGGTGSATDNGALGNLGFQVVRKASDQTVNNSTTLVNDSDLTFSAGANEEYTFLMYVTYTDASAGIADMKFTITGPTGSTISWFADRISLTDVVATEAYNQIDKDEVVTTGGSTTERVVVIRGVAVTGGTSGSITLQWAQNTAQANDLVVKTNSSVAAIRH